MGEAAGRYQRLVLVVGPAGSGKTHLLAATAAALGWPLLGLSLELSRRLLDLPAAGRALQAPALLAEVLAAAAGDADVLLVDDPELLFEPVLELDPLAALQHCARERTLVVSWPGRWDGVALTHAAPGHPEYVRYETPEAVICPL